MKNHLDPDLLEFLKKKIEEFFPKGAIQVYLFGSRARGDFIEPSDYDFAFNFSPECENKVASFFAEVSENAPTLHSMDLVDFSQISKEFREKILKEGQIIYERKIPAKI